MVLARLMPVQKIMPFSSNGPRVEETFFPQSTGIQQHLRPISGKIAQGIDFVVSGFSRTR